MVLHGNERREAVVARAQLHIVKLVAVHGRGAQRAHLARLYERIERLHRLFDWRGRIEAVDDV